MTPTQYSKSAIVSLSISGRDQEYQGAPCPHPFLFASNILFLKSTCYDGDPSTLRFWGEYKINEINSEIEVFAVLRATSPSHIRIFITGGQLSDFLSFVRFFLDESAPPSRFQKRRFKLVN